VIEIQHLPADALGLAPWSMRTLATRPEPASLPGMLVPEDLTAFPREHADLSSEARGGLAAALETALSRFEPHVAVLESARKLARPGATLILAGQQPGFLGGPLMNAYKALHAIRLARDLSARWNAPVVPAFWNHADDHDIAEVHHLWIQNRNLDLRKVSLAGMSSGRTSFANIRLDAESQRLEATAELLRQNLTPCDRLEPALELFMPRDGETFSNAFTRVMLELFGQHGLLVLEPEWIREPLSRGLARLVAGDLRDGLLEGSAALRAAGTEPAIDPENAALLFHHTDGKRNALRFAEDGFRYDDEQGSRTGTELAAEIVQEPGAWSAGALLRPIVQDLALPVVAYIGGWGELAYHAQLPPLRKRARAPRTAFVPRLSATIVDPPTRAALDKLEVTVRAALAARGQLGVDDREATESAVAASLRAIASDMTSKLDGERGALAELDRGLSQQLKKASKQITELVDKLATKAERVAANAQGRGVRHFRRINNMLFPRELPQERVRGLLEVVAVHGSGWLDELLEEIEPLPTEHLVVTLQEPA